MAVSCPCEIAGFADEGSCDDSADCMISAHYLTCFFADIVEFFKRDYLFVSCDLKDAVS